jgi:tRNA threonylcarbamoyladenosine biosynthesis protein TsaB
VTTIHAMILALDTSSAACTAALFSETGDCVASKDEEIGRGHAERLVPMIGEMLGGRTARTIIVGVGPGSFTGIRVAIAAAQGLAIGWNCDLFGMSSMGLIAASCRSKGEIAVAISGGHGELFVQQFDAETLASKSEIRNLVPSQAARFATAPLVVGSGASQLVEARGWGEAVDRLPSAARALSLPQELRTFAPKPVYARAPDAKAREAA